MVTFFTWRAFYRIPLLREHRDAVKILRDMFYVLIALHRAGKVQDYLYLRYLYFKMFDSFAQYGRADAKDTVDQILRIPWFRDNRHDLYQLIASYNNVIRNLPGTECMVPSKSVQEQVNKNIHIFFHSYKSLMNFDEKDEERVNQLLEQKEYLDEILKNFHQTVSIYFISASVDKF